jgi:hypothetical protein
MLQGKAGRTAAEMARTVATALASLGMPADGGQVML